MTDSKTKSLKIWNIVFLIVLFLYPLRHIWLGVELTDSAYSAGNYRFSEQINSMWFFSTFLANVVGKVLSALPLGNTLMGLNAYTSLFISIVAVAMYLFFVNVVKIPRWIAFLGEMLAISLCWCPTTILYNYMTYCYFNLAIIALYYGLVREKRWSMFLAGIMLGQNVLVQIKKDGTASKGAKVSTHINLSYTCSCKNSHFLLLLQLAIVGGILC